MSRPFVIIFGAALTLGVLSTTNAEKYKYFTVHEEGQIDAETYPVLYDLRKTIPAQKCNATLEFPNDYYCETEYTGKTLPWILRVQVEDDVAPARVSFSKNLAKVSINRAACLASAPVKLKMTCPSPL